VVTKILFEMKRFNQYVFKCLEIPSRAFLGIYLYKKIYIANQKMPEIEIFFIAVLQKNSTQYLLYIKQQWPL